MARFGRVIVLEDDLECSPFLQFMNRALDVYADDHRVISISGYIYPIKGDFTGDVFLRGADCWGWATWKRGWDLFRSDGNALLSELQSRQLSAAFDFDGSYPYTEMLTDQVNGKNDSWAIRWYASAFLWESCRFTLADRWCRTSVSMVPVLTVVDLIAGRCHWLSPC